MRITELKRLDNTSVACSLEYDGHHCTAIVKLLVDGDIRGLHLSGLSPEENRYFYNAPEGLDCTRQLWRFFDGENLTTPIELKPFVRDTKAVCAGPS